jgi:apolipoprotein N-acyltransferase
MQFFIYYLISFFLVAFGQPATSMLCSIAAAIFGYSLFFTACAEKTPKTRFILGMLFFTGVQLVQTSWLTSHFYNYIYVLYFLLAVVLGVQFGALSYFASKERIMHIPSILALSSLWTLLEWSRLFYFTGYTFNPIGLAMSGSEPLLQCASFFGIYGLSFWVMFGNLFLCRCYFRYAESKSILAIIQALIIIAFPFAVGYCMNTVHERAQKQYDQAHGPFQTLLLHTTMLPEEVDFVIRPLKPLTNGNSSSIPLHHFKKRLLI